MHTHSLASGLAIARLLDDEDDNEGLAQEAAEYVEHARVKLALDNAAITTGMMFAQPLIKMWAPHWKFAYTVGLVVGVKYTTEGFYLADIIDHVTQEFTLECLKAGESLAVELFDWNGMHQRCRDFRNALVSVALEAPPSARRPPARMPLQFGAPELEHVLIVDDSPIVCEMHRTLVLQIRPDARVHTVQSVGEASEYMRQQHAAEAPVHLILLDLNLAGSDEQNFTLDEVFSVPNGFDVASDIDESHSPEHHTPTGFAYKPFIAMVSYLANNVTERAIHDGTMNKDGSVRGCDVLLPKPLSIDSMRVLIEGCAV